jgi:MFS family permease
MQVKVFNLTKTEIAIMSVAGSFGQMIMMPVWGKLADRYGRRKLIVLACASTSTWSLAYAISQNYIQLLILNTIGSILGSSINIIPWIYLLDVTPNRRSRATLIALYNTVTGFSQAIGQYVGGEIAIQIGLRETMMLNSAMRLIFAIPMLILQETLTRRQ